MTMIQTGFTKLFGSIIASSIWSEDDKVRIVWITLLALSDSDGYVAGSIPGLAHLAHVEVDDCERALEKLRQPDRYSRTPDNEGRRIQVIEGGWLVLNRAKYRDLQWEEDRAERHRESNRRYYHSRKHSDSNSDSPGPNRIDSDRVGDKKEKEKEKKKEDLLSEPSVSDRSPAPNSEAAKDENAARWVFDFYVRALERNPKTYLYTEKRKRLILAVLKDAIQMRGDRTKAANFLAKCIGTMTESDFHMGRDPKTQGKTYNREAHSRLDGVGYRIGSYQPRAA